jgi:hypothetical protein
MMATPHTLVGIAIGAAVQNPVLAVPLAFLSHYATDLIPHWDVYPHFPSPDEQRTWKNLFILGDILLGIAVGITMTCYALWVVHDQSAALRIFLCGFAGALPDALYAPVVLAKSKNFWLHFNINIQQKLHIQSDAVFGNLMQWAIAAIAFLATLSSLK